MKMYSFMYIKLSASLNKIIKLYKYLNSLIVFNMKSCVTPSLRRRYHVDFCNYSTVVSQKKNEFANINIKFEY